MPRFRFIENDLKKLELHPTILIPCADFQKLPFTTKQDLRDNYPYGMFAVPMDNVVRIHASSGTTGLPTVVGYTARDITYLVGADGQSADSRRRRP